MSRKLHHRHRCRTPGCLIPDDTLLSQGALWDVQILSVLHTQSEDVLTPRHEMDIGQPTHGKCGRVILRSEAGCFASPTAALCWTGQQMACTLIAVKPIVAKLLKRSTINRLTRMNRFGTFRRSPIASQQSYSQCHVATSRRVIPRNVGPLPGRLEMDGGRGEAARKGTLMEPSPARFQLCAPQRPQSDPPKSPLFSRSFFRFSTVFVA